MTPRVPDALDVELEQLRRYWDSRWPRKDRVIGLRLTIALAVFVQSLALVMVFAWMRAS